MNHALKRERLIGVSISLMVLLLTVILVAVVSAQDDEVPAETPALEEGTVTHTVQIADVLERIAARYDVSVACIVETNELPAQGNLIRPGDTLTLSPACPPYLGHLPVENPRFEGLDRILNPETGEYFVTVGDTLDTIAQRFNVSVISLFVFNELDYGALIPVGQSLIIPTDVPPYGFYPGLNVGAEGDLAGLDIYVIQPHDVLDLVAAYFDVDLACLAEFNNIENPHLVRAGDVIAIPTDCPAYTGLSSAPVAPLRGMNITGASVRVVGSVPDVETTVEATQPTVASAHPPTVETAEATIEVTATPTPTSDTVQITLPATSVGTALPPLMGATVTPTPIG